MMKLVVALGALLACSACSTISGVDGQEVEYRRIEYLETVFLPATRACDRAGGFMIFEDPADALRTPAGLSYADMRLAIARGCGGI